MARIQIYGGRARTGSIILEPFSKLAEEKLRDGKLKPLAAFLSEFPKMGYGTDWGSWEENNIGFIGKAALMLGGGNAKMGGSGLTGQIVQMITSKIAPAIQMLGGANFKPPVMTDSWTQISAQLDEKMSYIDFDLELLAYPVLRKGKVHVEGLRPDSENLDQAINIGSKRCANMWDWLSLGKEAVMPEFFTTKQIENNLVGIVKNLNGKSGESGKMIIEGASKIAHVPSGLWSDTESTESTLKGAVEGAGQILTALTGTAQRVGYSFTMQLFDCDGRRIFDSKAPDSPLDFYITNLSFDFSPHIVQLIDSNGKRTGCCPEWCKIKLALSSTTRVSPNQVIKMCEWEK